MTAKEEMDQANRIWRYKAIALEEAARTCEAIVIDGRAWTHDQQVAAEALFAAAKNIRAKVQMTRWEYQTLFTERGFEDEDLNAGRDGWEAVSVYFNDYGRPYSALMKRPVADAPSVAAPVPSPQGAQ